MLPALPAATAALVHAPPAIVALAPVLPAVTVALALALLAAAAMHAWRRGGEDDERWAAARAALGPSAQELVVWDTRLIRPLGAWGGVSTAVDSFVVRARDRGCAWLEPSVESLRGSQPLGVRALVTEAGGRPAAYLQAYLRDGRTPGRLVVQTVNDRVVEESLVGQAPGPPPDLHARLSTFAEGAARGR